MKFWVAFIVFLVASLGAVRSVQIVPVIEEYLPSYFSERTVNLSGNNLLETDYLFSMLPENSNFTWFLMPEQVKDILERNPLVKQAKVTPCTNWSLNCFNIQIQEEKPDYLYKVANHWWLVSRAGEFLLPINDEKSLIYFDALPRLEDLIFETSNTEFLSIRLRYLIKLNDFLLEQGLNVQRLQLQESNDLKVNLREYHGDILLSSLDADSQKFELEVQNLISFFKSSQVPAEAWSLDLRPKRPVLKTQTL